ncbi:MAG: dephospho-CoA kinase [Acidobacteria bacterium]|nr:dephospho-CoA kinase [Acidobacteriota bacterium]
MLRVGLTGGLATGKSFVGACLSELGCHLIQADLLGHEVLLPDGEAYPAVAAEFGPGILRADRAIDRKLLAADVFGRPERLARLNSLVHPHIFQRQEELVSQYSAADPTGIVVIEAAIMIEAGSHKRCQRLIVVVCSEEQQIERAMKRDGATREEVLARLGMQMPLAEKLKFADYVIDTTGGKEHTREQTRKVYESLRSIRL